MSRFDRVMVGVQIVVLLGMAGTMTLTVVRGDTLGAATFGVLFGIFLDQGARDYGRWLKHRRAAA